MFFLVLLVCCPAGLRAQDEPPPPLDQPMEESVAPAPSLPDPGFGPSAPPPEATPAPVTDTPALPPAEAEEEEVAAPAAAAPASAPAPADTAKKEELKEVMVKTFKGQNNEYRSPKAALFRSLIVPGWGQYFARSWKSAIGYLAAEIGIISGVVYYTQKITERTVVHQNWINDHFRNQKYAGWVDWLVVSDQFGVASDKMGSHNSRLVEFDSAKRGGDIWEDPYLEDDTTRWKTYVAGFLDNLQKTDSQQYYEVVGKYHSFIQGWDDATPSYENGDWDQPPLANFAPFAIDSIRTDTSKNKPDTFWMYYDTAMTEEDTTILPNYFGYSENQLHAEFLRNEIRVAATYRRNITFLLLANHLISAVDAAIRANYFNQRLRETRAPAKPRLELEAVLFRGLTTTARGFQVTYRF